ncbi:MAG: pentapeptide repeat-containing protein [Deltaproteobacteria bacterium]|nr:pentapeptide repeat-containing protein [Deltaproteobacteria bacterium]
MPICKSWMKYAWEGRQCENPPWEPDPEGLCILHSLKPEKDKQLFDQTLQQQLARQDFDFRGVFFPGPVSFAQWKFQQPANFQRAYFAGWVDFREAEFTATADFSYARFAREANFAKAAFRGPVRFSRSELYAEADFREVCFGDEALFQQINAASRAPFQAFFQNIHLEPQARLSFQDTSLEQVSFLGTDMRQVAFYNVHWPVRRGRRMVFDEVLLQAKSKPAFFRYGSVSVYNLSYEDVCARLEMLYRYLKLNYEGAGDHKQAGDFHYGEMEMHRRADPWRRRFPFSWYNLYWALSGYGERPLRALAWLFGLLGVMATLMAAAGLYTPAGEPLGFGTAVIFLLEQATLLRPAWATPTTTGGHVVSAISRIMLPAQGALFILALRNRLGRRR